jgi:transcriptional regulator with XRE-family HTH domain
MTDERLREIGAELRRLRMAGGLTGMELATRTGVGQATVSRVERGQRVAGPDVVVRLFTALRLKAPELTRHSAAAREAYRAQAPTRVDSGASFRRLVALEREQHARVVRGFEPAVIPRLLRTASARQATVLEKEDRRFTFVLTEAVIRTRPSQLEYLLAVARRPNVRLGVVSLTAHGPPLPLHGFTLYDNAAVVLETYTRELTLYAEREVHEYIRIFKNFEQSAIFGTQAQKLIETTTPIA